MNKLIMYMDYPFVRYAVIVGALIALCSSLLGVMLVLKRYSFIGDGLSHIAFGAMAAAAVWFKDIPSNFIVMPVTVIASVLLLKGGQNRKIKGDAALAMLSVGSLAFGYMLMNIFSPSSNISSDVCGTLFGSASILTLKQSDVLFCIIVSVIVVCVFILFYNRLFAVTFDESFAAATGINANFYNLMTAVITAVVIVMAMNLVGSLLASALIVFPALSAMRVFKSFKSVIISSALMSVISAVIGILISILASTPTGATITIVNIIVFFIFCGIGRLMS